MNAKNRPVVKPTAAKHTTDRFSDAASKSKMDPLRLVALLAAMFAMTQLAGAAGTTVWTGVPNTSATTNWSDTLNWSPGPGANNPPGTADTVAFGGLNGSGVAVVDNVVDSSTTIASLLYTNV